MKLKEILSGVCILVGLLSACSTEEAIDKRGEGKDTSFSLVLSTGDPATKAAAPNYTYATKDELVINECVVAVFKMDNGNVGEMVGTPISASLTSTTTAEGKQGYSLTGITGKTGPTRILVIANSPYSKYKDLTTWDGFMAATEDVDGSFDAKKLVKVGYLDVELASAEAKPSYSIKLAQLTARIDLTIVPSSNDYSFVLSNVKVENINTASDVLLVNRKNSKSQYIPTDFKVFNGAADGLTFYTYENVSDTFVKVTFTGKVTDHTTNVTETKNYSLVLNKEQAKNGLEHGTLYKVIGTYDVKTRQMTFSWSILPWSVTLREVWVDIIKSAYLVVRDLEMTMPNMTTISTTFESSSSVTISNLKISNGNANVNKVCTVTLGSGNDGNIIIESKLPVNFVPKEISFTVTNEEGLKQNVVVHQYPPLYIAAETANRKPTGSSDQDNDKLYRIKTLVSDFSVISQSVDDYQLDEKGFTHTGKLSNRQTTAIGYANEIRNNAYSGFPLLESEYFEKVVSNIENDTKTIKEVTANCTVAGVENNNLISPCFILASQNGINSILDAGKAKENCAGYYEEVKKTDGSGGTITYETGSWRVPTKAELMLIDILQNTEKCDVKKILEGGGYQHGLTGQLSMMDPRISSSVAVRCVRDIKTK